MFSIPLSEGLPMFLFQGKFLVPTRFDETLMCCVVPSSKHPLRKAKVHVKIHPFLLDFYSLNNH